MNQSDIMRKLVESKKASLRPILMRTYHRCFTKYGDFDLSPLAEEVSDFERHFISQALNDEGREALFTELAFLMWDLTTGLIDSKEIPQDPILFELWCAEQISSQGWEAVNTQASGDQGVDVIAKRHAKSVAVQCKRYSKPVGNQAVQEVIAGKTFYSTNSACVISTAGFSKSAKDLARASQVKLLDAREISGFSRLFGYESAAGEQHDGPAELEQFVIARRLSEKLELEFVSPGEIALCQLMKFALSVSPEDDPGGFGKKFRALQNQTEANIPEVISKLEKVSASTECLEKVEIVLTRVELLVLLGLSGWLCLNSSITIASDRADTNADSLRGSKNPKVQAALRSGLPVELPVYQVFDHATGEEIQRGYKRLLASSMLESNLIAKMPKSLKDVFQDHPFLDVDAS